MSDVTMVSRILRIFLSFLPMMLSGCVYAETLILDCTEKYHWCKKDDDLMKCGTARLQDKKLANSWFMLSIDTTKSTVVVAESRATEGSISVSENEFNIDYPYLVLDGSLRKTILLNRLTGFFVSNVRWRDSDRVIVLGTGECVVGTRKF
ncbi:MAG: hypothetical protein D4R79_02380 [Comamonadaceae bacterium]|nr:MAG: hypothetical protein D4R79_02380 [Comamonadaceae bacterium]